MNGWLILAGVAGLAVLGVPLLQATIAVNPPRQASQITPEALGLRYEEVTLETSDGLELAAWWVPAANETSSAVLVSHGYPMDKGDVLPATRFLHEDHHLLYLDLRSFGDSEGERTTLGLEEVRDVRAAVDHALARPGVERVAAWGFSLSATVMLRADDPRLSCTVAEAPFASLSSLARDVYGGLGPLAGPAGWLTTFYGNAVFGLDADAVDLPASLDDEGPPVLLIHGAEDDQVPPEHSARIAEALGERATRWVVDGAGHGGAQALEPDAYRERVRAFLDEHLAPDDASEAADESDYEGAKPS